MKKLLLPFLILFISLTSSVQAQNPILWGTTIQVGAYEVGSIFNYNTHTGVETDVYDFGTSNTDGAAPEVSLLKANNGLLYGVCSGGGSSNDGTIFSYNISTGVETTVYTTGGYNALIQGTNGLIYGTDPGNGTYNLGTIFSFNTDSNTKNILFDFYDAPQNAESPTAPVQVGDSLLYMVTQGGFPYSDGTISSYNIYTGEFIIWYTFDPNNYDGQPKTPLVLAKNGLLYGITYFGGMYGYGDIFSFNPANDSYAHCYDFNGSINNNGGVPIETLVPVGDTLLYGLTAGGGNNGGYGTIFKYNTSTGAVTFLYGFDLSDIGYSYEEMNGLLLAASNGSIYGTSAYGGTYQSGQIFGYNLSTKIESDLYNFEGSSSAPAGPSGDMGLIEDDPPYVTLSQTTICSGSPDTIKASGEATYTWSPSTGLSATTGDSVIASPTITTTYTVRGTTSGVTDTTIVTVNVNQSLVINTSLYPQSFCNGGSTTIVATGADTYTWVPYTEELTGDGDTVIASPTITTTYTVMGTNTYGCTATNTVTVTVKPVPVLTVLPNSPSYCPNGSATLTASGGDTYTWSPSTSLSATTGSSIMANPTATTTYTLTGTGSDRCATTNTVTVTVNPNPTITADSYPFSICQNGSATIEASGGNTYTWSPAAGLSTTTGVSVTASPTTTTTYTVTGTSIYGCSATGIVTLPVNANPILNISTDPDTICLGDDALLTVSGGNTYTWAPSAGLNATTGSSVTASPLATTTYFITGTNLNECSTTDTAILYVRTCSGVNQLTVNSEQLSVYPNPAGSFFHVAVTLNQTSDLQLRLVNMMGQTVWSADAGNVSSYQNNISVADLAEGVYLLEMVTGGGEETKEIVVTH